VLFLDLKPDPTPPLGIPTVCPPWCVDHLAPDPRIGSVAAHQLRLGGVAGLRVTVSQGADDAAPRVGLSGDVPEIIGCDDAVELAEMLTVAARIAKRNGAGGRH
jgi:hypothetical protein